MDTPQESQRGRLIAFPQRGRQQPATRTPPSDGPRSADGGADGGDTLVGEFPAPRRDTATVSSQRDRPDALVLGVSSGAFYPHLPTELVPHHAAALGVRQIEVMLQTAGEYQPAFIADLAARARDAGVRVRSVHTLLGLHPMLDAYPRRAEEGRVLFDLGIAAAAELGAGVLVWHGARRQEADTPEGWERFVRLTAELAAACGEAGITLGLENVSWCALATVRDIVRLATRLEEIGEHVGFVFDPFQASRAGANPFMVLAAMGNRLVNVHLSDHHDDHPEQHLAPGDGELPWSALLRAVAGSGYGGPLIVESPLGEGAEVMERVRAHLVPRIRSVVEVPPVAMFAGDSPVPLTLPEGVRDGIALFNQRRFFEAHEVIEHEWHAERAPVRRLYQGILQIGVGFYHALNGNQRGAVLLLTGGIEKTADFTPEALGVRTGPLVAQAQACLETIRALGSAGIAAFDAGTIPRIELIGTTPADLPVPPPAR